MTPPPPPPWEVIQTLAHRGGPRPRSRSADVAAVGRWECAGLQCRRERGTRASRPGPRSPAALLSQKLALLLSLSLSFTLYQAALPGVPAHPTPTSSEGQTAFCPPRCAFAVERRGV